MEEEAEVKPVEVNPLEEKSKEFYNQLFSKDQPEVSMYMYNVTKSLIFESDSLLSN